ncbi:type VII secretion target [Lentzea sp. NPDC060358]|uniref:type VII secretion target n=1 Tax=Lentzea sp. NPDC060358 TaxID=3347103 RepID=UPI003653381D
MSGFQANAGEMMSSATTIQGIATEIENYKAKITASAVSEGDFGRAHTAGGAKYKAGLPKLAEAIGAYSAAMKGLSDKLRESANGYEWTDEANAANVGKQGR